MYEILWLLVGSVATGIAMMAAQRSKHAAKMRADEQKYEKRWLEAIELLKSNGQLTEEQVKSIMPPVELPQGVGTSSDRCAVEIARAEAGLPPADNLLGMTSSDATAVKKARIKHRTVNL